MARITEAELERLKHETAIETLAEASGVKLKREGEDLVGLCPFHEETTPSFRITLAKAVFHCFGCDAGGSVVDFVMKRDGISFAHAVAVLRSNVPSLAAQPIGPRRGRQEGLVPRVGTTRKLAGASELDGAEGDDELMQRVVAYYHATLKRSPEALEYLQKRGLEGEELMTRFQLGFGNRTLGYRLPCKNRKNGAAIRERLEKHGILRASGHEHFTGSLVVPIFDRAGRVVQMYGRKIGERLGTEVPKHLNLPSPLRGVFNAEAFEGNREIILCEALIDALTFWNAGHRQVTATLGVGGFTDCYRKAFEEGDVERVYIAFDRDKAGDEGAERVGTELESLGLEVFRVLFPHGMDANEYARKVKPADKSLSAALRGAQWLKGTRRRRPAMLGALAEEAAREGMSAAKTTTTDAANEVPDVELHLQTEAPEGVADVEATAAAATAAEERPPSSTSDVAVTVEHETHVREEVGERGATDIPSLAAAPTAAPNSAGDDEQPHSAPPAPEPTGSPAEPTGSPSEMTRGDLWLEYEDRRWRIRGHERAMQQGASGPTAELRVNLLVSRGDAFHVDTVELYSSRQRAAFTKVASDELGVGELVIKKDLGGLLLELEKRQEEARRRATGSGVAQREMSEEERAAALALLRNPKLIERLLEDFERLGVVGEVTNKLVGYVATVSRKLDEPLAIVIQSSSAAGKSSLMDAVLTFVPEEDRIQYSAMTGQSLFYMGQSDLKHKVLAIVEEEGAERASYALKLLQSEGELTIASTGKDPVTGRLTTQEYRVEGPVMIMMTTTAVEIDEELLNRCIVLTVDEGREQTRAIHVRQRRARTLAGVIERQERTHLRKLYQNAQRLLEPIEVVIPNAERLQFDDRRTRARRDHMKYLTMIRTVALLHQHQRPVKTAEHRGGVLRYIETEPSDIELATELCRKVLERTSDELEPQAQRLLDSLKAMVAELGARDGMEPRDVHFTRRQVRERFGLGATQLKHYFRRLEELEYIEVVSGGGARRRAAYALVVCEYDPIWAAKKDIWSDAGRHLVGRVSRPDLPKVAEGLAPKTASGRHVGGHVAGNGHSNGATYANELRIAARRDGG